MRQKFDSAFTNLKHATNTATLVIAFVVVLAVQYDRVDDFMVVAPSAGMRCRIVRGKIFLLTIRVIQRLPAYQKSYDLGRWIGVCRSCNQLFMHAHLLEHVRRLQPKICFNAHRSSLWAPEVGRVLAKYKPYEEHKSRFGQYACVSEVISVASF